MAGFFEEIEAFAAVVACGTFAGAAEKLGVSPPVVTRRLQSLEARLTVTLFHRSTRRVALTEAGRLYHARVGAVPEQVAAATDAVRDASAGGTGQLRVIMPSYFASSGFHHEVIPSFLAKHPAVQLTLSVVADPLEHLDEDFDLLVAALGAGRRLPTTTHVRRRLMRFPRAVFASPAYLSAHGTPKRPEDLHAHNCLSYPDRRWRFADPEGRVPIIVDTRGTLTTNSNAMLYSGVMGGIGIAYTTPYFFESEQGAERVVRVLENYTRSAAMEIHLFHPAGTFRPRRARAFADALVSHFDPRLNQRRP